MYEGSSKNVYLSKDTATFEFTDRYSVFDWGAMPDQLKSKGEALALMGKVFFELVGKRGVPHHYLGLTDAEGEVLEPCQLSRFMKVEAVEVHRPHKTPAGYDYTFYQDGPTNCLVPLEVIFRWGAPKGSSLLKRFPHVRENERFKTPIIEFTTKLEAEDRLVSTEEAMELAGLTQFEFDLLKKRTVEVAMQLKEVLALMHVELWDGKLEWAFNGTDRDFKLVDAIGLDELRVSFQGHPLSKEFLRHHYRNTQWYNALNEAKKIAQTDGGDFKKICTDQFKQRPLPLPLATRMAAETLYVCFANDLSRVFTGVAPFGASMNLAHWVKEFA